jgi:hypothetical protein
MLTAAVLSGVVGVLFSLVFSWFPVLSEKFAALQEGTKKLIMFLSMVFVAAVIFGFNCAGVFKDYIPAVTCDQAGVEQFLVILAAAAVANQTAYMLTPQTAKVKAAKASRG